MFTSTLQPLRDDAQKLYPSVLTLTLALIHTGTEPPCVFSSNFLLMMLQAAPKPFLEGISILPASKNQLGSQNIPPVWALPTQAQAFAGRNKNQSQTSCLPASHRALSEILGPDTFMEQTSHFTVFEELSAKPEPCVLWEKRLKLLPPFLWCLLGICPP